MRISRLYIPNLLKPHSYFNLEGESAHYLKTVLRLKTDARLTVFNGEGGEYPAVVTALYKDGLQLQLGEFNPRESESFLNTLLGLGISRGERMDMAIQKAVELGVTVLTPLITERCVVRLDDNRKEQRMQHWRKVVQNACEQCGRNRIPLVAEPMKIEDWIRLQTGLCLILDPDGAHELAHLPQPNTPVCLLSGPEGGFAPSERETALAAGFLGVRLGPRVLRTETAALAALAAIQTLWGDLGASSR